MVGPSCHSDHGPKIISLTMPSQTSNPNFLTLYYLSLTIALCWKRDSCQKCNCLTIETLNVCCLPISHCGVVPPALWSAYGAFCNPVSQKPGQSLEHCTGALSASCHPLGRFTLTRSDFSNEWTLGAQSPESGPEGTECLTFSSRHHLLVWPYTSLKPTSRLSDI